MEENIIREEKNKMEMTYGGALVMPSSYAMMDEEEMTYLEGGSIQTLKNNLWGLTSIITNYMIRYFSNATIGSVLKMNGLSWGQIAQLAGTYSGLVAKASASITAITRWLGAHAVAVGITAAVVGATILWNFKVFY